MKTKTMIILLTFSSVLLANPFAKPSQPSGILKMNQPHPSANIFPVSLFEVDGKQIIVRDNSAWLKPGKHTIKVKSKINLDSRSKKLVKRQKVNNLKQDNTLEINIEDGKTYYVGFDTNDQDPNKWHPVVWKVK